MATRARLVPVAALALAVAGLCGHPAHAQSDAAWQGEYFDNQDLSGTPAITRPDPALDFSWGYGSPFPGLINPDHFAIRWTRTVNVTAGHYRVVVRSDDGYRVRLDGNLIVDRWYPQPPTAFAFETDLTAGSHHVQVEYFEQTGNAEFHGAVEPVQPTDPPNGAFTGTYFGTVNLAGTPVAIRPDPAINFSWGNGSPFPGLMAADNFSVRWTGRVGGSPGTYRFTTVTDDGARLWINGQLLIDAWYPQAPTPHSADVYLSGPADLRLEYFEASGSAMAKLSYAITGGGSPPAPAAGGVIVDDGAPGWQLGGSPSLWATSLAGYHGSHWSLNRAQTSNDYAWARWYPNLTPGNYEVFAFIPSRNATTHAATYWVAHNGQFHSRVVDQLPYSDVWVSLGTYAFAGDGTEYASLNSITGEPAGTTRVGFDALRFTKR